MGTQRGARHDMYVCSPVSVLRFLTLRALNNLVPGPGLIGDHDRCERERHPQHDLKCQLAVGRIVDVETVLRAETLGDDVGE